MIKFDEYEKSVNMITCSPHKCKICGLGNIEEVYDVCRYCGWENDDFQNENPDYEGGANQMSLNQYKKFWEENKDEILKELANNRFVEIQKAKEYFKNNS